MCKASGGRHESCGGRLFFFRKLFQTYIIMTVTIIRATCPTPVEREFILQEGFGPVVITDNKVSVDVDEFTDFLSRLYHAYCALSRQSYPQAMRCRLECVVRDHRFFVKVDEQLGGIRYGEL